MAEPLFSFQEVERILEGILANKSLCKVASRSGFKFVVFSHASMDETIQSRYVKEKATLEAMDLGLPSREELEKTLANKKLVPAEDEKKILELEERVTAQNRLLQLTKIEARRKEILDNVERYEKEIHQLRSKASGLMYMSAESKADEESLLYLAWVSTYDVMGSRYWDSFQKFEDETDLVIRNSVLDSFLKFNTGLPTATIRFLARHSLWRIRYSAALKMGGPLFSRGLEDLTPDQLNLLYWSNYYQSIYEMLPDEQPDSETIENDEALDAYMEALFKRRDQERNEGRVKRSSGNKKGKLSAWDRGEELIITANHPEYFKMQYSEERVKAGEGTSEIEVMAPNSRRARNRASARRNR